MPNPSFLRADSASTWKTRKSLMGLQAEYLRWVHGEIARCFPVLSPRAGLSLPPEDLPGLKASQTENLPNSAYYLIAVNGEAAGMCGLRPLGAGTVEVKRLYVRPAYRGLHLGSSALRQLYADACQAGYTRICLDTALFMQAAHRLYEAHGYADCAAYEGTEVPQALHSHWRFMQRPIQRPSLSTTHEHDFRTA